MKTSVAVVGASGRLGAVVCRVITESPDFDLVAQLGSSSDLSEMLVADVVVDVSLPSVSKSVVDYAIANGKKVLVGTSGWSAEKISTLDSLLAAHLESGVIIIPNFSLGSAVAAHIAAIAAKNFDSIEIVETHAPTKVDSPSGTAVNTAERLSAVRNGKISAPTADQEARGEIVAGIPVHSLRLQGVIARQDVIFGGFGETITVNHTTISDRSYEAGILASLRAVKDTSGVLVGLDKVISL